MHVPVTQILVLSVRIPRWEMCLSGQVPVSGTKLLSQYRETVDFEFIRKLRHNYGMLIKTERLQLRPLDDRDVQSLSVLFVQENFTRFLALENMELTAARLFASEFVYCSIAEFQHSNTGAMAVVTAANQEFLGYAGLRPLPDRTSALELTYAIDPLRWSEGLAAEAAAAIVNWGFRSFETLHEIIALARDDNPASIRVMQKIGLEPQGRTDRYYGETLALFSRRRDAGPCLDVPLLKPQT